MRELNELIVCAKCKILECASAQNSFGRMNLKLRITKITAIESQAKNNWKKAMLHFFFATTDEKNKKYEPLGAEQSKTAWIEPKSAQKVLSNLIFGSNLELFGAICDV